MLYGNVAKSRDYIQNQWDIETRRKLHEDFDKWLDEIEKIMEEKPKTLEEITKTIFSKRYELTGKIAQKLVEKAHLDTLSQQ